MCNTFLLDHGFVIHSFRDRCKVSLLILSTLKEINYFLFPLKSSENLWFSNDF